NYDKASQNGDAHTQSPRAFLFFLSLVFHLFLLVIVCVFDLLGAFSLQILIHFANLISNFFVEIANLKHLLPLSIEQMMVLMLHYLREIASGSKLQKLVPNLLECFKSMLIGLVTQGPASRSDTRRQPSLRNLF